MMKKMLMLGGAALLALGAVAGNAAAVCQSIPGGSMCAGEFYDWGDYRYSNLASGFLGSGSNYVYWGAYQYDYNYGGSSGGGTGAYAGGNTPLGWTSAGVSQYNYAGPGYNGGGTSASAGVGPAYVGGGQYYYNGVCYMWVSTPAGYQSVPCGPVPAIPGVPYIAPP